MATIRRGAGALGHALALSKPEARGSPRRAVSRVSTRRRARTRTGGAVFRPRARQRQRCRLGCRLGRRRAGAETSPVGGPGSVAERTRLATRASLAHAAFLAACGAHRKPPRRSCASPPRRDRRTFAGDYSSRRRLRNTAERRPHGAQMRHTSPRGAQIQPGGFRAHAIRCYAAALPCISTTARRRRRLDRREERREAPRREVRVQRLGGVRGEMESRDGTSSLRARATGCTRVRSSPRKSIFGDCWSARRQPAATQSTYLREYLASRVRADAAAADEKRN